MKTSLAVLALATLLATPGCAAESASITATAPDLASTPLSEDAQGRPSVMTTINGQGPFELALDTAAQYTAISQELATQLALTPVGQAALHGAAGVQQSNLHRLATMTIAGETFSDVTAIEMAESNGQHGHSGVVGANLFAQNRIEFDFADEVFRVGAGAQPVPAGFAAVDARFVMGTFAIIPVTIGGVSAMGVVDTGAKHSVGNPALMQALGYGEHDARLSMKEETTGATGHSAPVLSGARHELAAGGTSLGTHDINFGDLPVFTPLGLADGPAIIIGSDVWTSLDAMAIDYPSKQLQIKP